MLLNTSQTFEYDNNGNILAKIVDGVRAEYVYRQNGWRDQLLSYDGKAIGSYDALGNPWQYKGVALEWSHGRNLAKYGNNITYASGIRTSKTIGNIETTYYLDGSRIIAEETTIKQ